LAAFGGLWQTAPHDCVHCPVKGQCSHIILSEKFFVSS
jgi:hypothetical protein